MYSPSPNPLGRLTKKERLKEFGAKLTHLQRHWRHWNAGTSGRAEGAQQFAVHFLQRGGDGIDRDENRDLENLELGTLEVKTIIEIVHLEPCITWR